MQHGALAEQFNDVGRALEGGGYRVVVRRIRALIEAGRLDEAVAVAREASDALGSRGESLGELAQTLESWSAAGGDPDALVTDPAWVEGVATETRPARFIEAATRDASLGELVATLAEQQRAQAAGEPLPRAPEALVSPDDLPPLPRSPSRDGISDRASLGRIVPESVRGRRAVIEAPSQLTERSLDLDESPAPIEALDAEPTEDLAIEDAAGGAPAPPTDDFFGAGPEPEPPTPAASSDGPPDLMRPPEMSFGSAKAQTGSDSSAKVVIGVLLAAAIAAAVWFFTGR